ncbi:hypothetical protein AAVH_28930 [Aphelenchoides avenae]|nr:hypothetical protein AAVH_28930 [Aphelenchus avenae]
MSASKGTPKADVLAGVAVFAVTVASTLYLLTWLFGVPFTPKDSPVRRFFPAQKYAVLLPLGLFCGLSLFMGIYAIRILISERRLRQTPLVPDQLLRVVKEVSPTSAKQTQRPDSGAKKAGAEASKRNASRTTERNPVPNQPLQENESKKRQRQYYSRNAKKTS